MRTEQALELLFVPVAICVLGNPQIDLANEIGGFRIRRRRHIPSRWNEPLIKLLQRCLASEVAGELHSDLGGELTRHG